MFDTSDILKCTDDWMFIGMQDRMKTQTWLKIRFMICFAHVYKSHKYVQYVNIYIYLESYIYSYIWYMICIQCGKYDYIWTNIAHFVIESILSLLYIVMERLDSIYMWDHLGTSWGEHTRCPGSSSWPCWPYWPCWPWAFRVVGSCWIELGNFLRSLFWPMSNFFLWSWPSNIIIISISGATNAHAHYYSSKMFQIV